MNEINDVFYCRFKSAGISGKCPSPISLKPSLISHGAKKRIALISHESEKMSINVLKDS